MVKRPQMNVADDDPLLELSGDIDGLPADMSEEFSRYLAETFGAPPDPCDGSA